jgi:hypothetical protein
MVRYGFKNGRVTAILWSTSVLHDGADGPPLADPAGDSISTAILNMQTNEIDGVAWEYRYLAFHPCGNDGRWRLKQQALMNKEGRATICFTSCVHRRRSNATSFSTSQTFSASSEQKFASALDGRASALDLRSR